MKAGTFKYQADSKRHKPPSAIWYRGYAEYFGEACEANGYTFEENGLMRNV